MKKREIEIGQRVEITGMPFKGRTGIVRGQSRVAGIAKVLEIWCDHPDFAGRQLVRVGSRDLRLIE